MQDSKPAPTSDPIDARDDDVNIIRRALDAMHFGEAQGWAMSEQEHDKVVDLLAALRRYDPMLF